ncbi:anti-sigma-I factor RsgI [Bacillaceae bacterium]
MRKGIVLKVEDDRVTVLTPQGEFVRVRKTRGDYEIGGEILLEPSSIAVLPEKTVFRRTLAFGWLRQKRALTAAALALFLVIASFSLPRGSQEVYAYVSVDINPSLELAVDERLRVIEIHPYDEEGERVLAALPVWQKRPLREVAEHLVEVSEQQGYLQRGREMLITMTFMADQEENGESRLQEEVETTIQEVAAEEELILTAVHNSKEQHEEARRLGISPGRYAVAVAAKEQGIALSLAEIEGKSISELAREVGGIGRLFAVKRPDRKDEDEHGNGPQAGQERNAERDKRLPEKPQGEKDVSQRGKKTQKNTDAPEKKAQTGQLPPASKGEPALNHGKSGGKTRGDDEKREGKWREGREKGPANKRTGKDDDVRDDERERKQKADRDEKADREKKNGGKEYGGDKTP